MSVVTPGGSDGVGTVAGVTVSVVTPGGSDGVGTVAGVTVSVVTPGGSDGVGSVIPSPQADAHKAADSVSATETRTR